MKFKDRLVQLRKEFGLTQIEFAEKIGFSRTAISAWEIGRNEPSNEDTIKIANFFNVSVDYLIGKSNIKNPEKIDMDDVDVSFLAGVKGLNETNKMIIQNTLEALLTKQEKDEKDNSKKEK